MLRYGKILRGQYLLVLSGSKPHGFSNFQLRDHLFHPLWPCQILIDSRWKCCTLNLTLPAEIYILFRGTNESPLPKYLIHIKSQIELKQDFPFWAITQSKPDLSVQQVHFSWEYHASEAISFVDFD